MAQNNQARKGLDYLRLQIKREPMEFIPPRRYRINKTTQKLDPTSQVTRKKYVQPTMNPYLRQKIPKAYSSKIIYVAITSLRPKLGLHRPSGPQNRRKRPNQSLCSEVPMMTSHPQMGEPPFLNVNSNHNVKRLPESLPIDSPMCAVH